MALLQQVGLSLLQARLAQPAMWCALTTLARTLAFGSLMITYLMFLERRAAILLLLSRPMMCGFTWRCFTALHWVVLSRTGGTRREFTKEHLMAV